VAGEKANGVSVINTKQKVLLRNTGWISMEMQAKS
jgi:hypothetical protein